MTPDVHSPLRVLMWAPPISRGLLETAIGGVRDLHFESVGSGEQVLARLPQAEVLVIPQQFYVPDIHAAVANGRAPRLRRLQLLTSGREKLDGLVFPETLEVLTAAGGLAPVVAEHAVSLLLALARKFHVTLASQALRAWDQSPKDGLVSLNGKTVSVIGFGAIGSEIGARLNAFGASVIAVTRSGRDMPLADESVGPGRLDEVLARSDAAVLALPMSQSTHHLLDARRLAACRPGLLLVNVGRGTTIDSDALAAALHAGRLGGAGLDVTDPEPLPPDHPLWQAPNLIVTPHIGAGGGYEYLARYVSEELRRYSLAGRVPETAGI